jgi:diaminopimelate epimerase
MKYDFRFVKCQGCGNDFIIKDELEGPRTPDRDRSALAKTLCDRHFKVGADGVIFLERARGVDGSMRLFEPAGNEADMCGNGIRCIAAYLTERLGRSEVDVFTRDGVKHIVRRRGSYTVEMGLIRTKRNDLKEYISDNGKASDSMMDIEIKAGRRALRGSLVNSGEPHFVSKTSDLASLDVKEIGDSVNRNHKRFPKGVNLNFVQVIGPHRISTRTYERGVYDETLACGTGATASAAVALMLGWVKPGQVEVKVRGGTLEIKVDKNRRAFMTGPAEAEFEGVLKAIV